MSDNTSTVFYINKQGETWESEILHSMHRNVEPLDLIHQTSYHPIQGCRMYPWTHSADTSGLMMSGNFTIQCYTTSLNNGGPQPETYLLLRPTASAPCTAPGEPLIITPGVMLSYPLGQTSSTMLSLHCCSFLEYATKSEKREVVILITLTHTHTYAPSGPDNFDSPVSFTCGPVHQFPS